ncbi:MAG: DUF494 domain-containing protein [Gammaproteobacteria bacterium]|nr:DUF494 domain-containing protein [Gammaproteobacteria bacterium]MDH5594290.1 DUF494 domain-containing protein [Gammaproteobacteria bacterium]
MKENVLDILVYLFENYINDDETELAVDEETLRTELVESGFAEKEVVKAFSWLEDLNPRVLEEYDGARLTHTDSIRVYTDRENEKLDMVCRGFLMFLEQVGILDAHSRELILDRVMALEADDISLEQLKWVILLVLFNQPGQEEAFAWMEDLVYEEMVGAPH